jgi:hypothetical protein
MQANAYGIAEIPPGSVNLHAYPGLVHAPQQHGEGIRFAHDGRPVEDVASQGLAEDVSDSIDRIAASLGVPFGDVCDALKYLRDAGAI